MDNENNSFLVFIRSYEFYLKGVRGMPWYRSHSYLNEYIRENHCRTIMEIGVYNGENAKSMVETAIQNIPAIEVEYYGFDFFSSYSSRQVGRKLDETGCKYTLYEGNTLETVPEVVKSLPKMDLVFIDGGKSFIEAWSDWKNSSTLMHEGTGVFVHNVGFSGVGKMVENISRELFEVEIFYAPSEGSVALIRKKPVN
ncbi:MAG: class I SAM-dependent methyltransferase [Candidatus Bathyarchaeota archaeon]|nr:class I SAM-dependent methyltransferase [Candidatus Bathyarchaeota archaeon]